MTFLFQATIGPVQSFIASARRTRDLWFGSTLLSELAKTAARTIAQTPDSLLIFPNPENPGDLAPITPLKVANKILARVAAKPETLGMAIETALQTDLEAITKRLFAGPLASSRLNQQAARQQIEDLIDYAWVAVEEDERYTASNDRYSRARLELEALLAARKNTRNYQHATWQSINPKSSIDGQLESVIEEDLYPRPRHTPQDQSRRMLELYRQFHAGRAERLSGVDLLKRLGEFTDRQAQQRGENALFSTSHIASLPYLQRLRQLFQESTPDVQTSLKASWRAYMGHVSTIHIPDSSAVPNAAGTSPVNERIPSGKPPHPILLDRDGALLYGERLIEDAASTEKWKQATNALQAFFKLVSDHTKESGEPTPYYAILVADGDGMGKVIDHGAKIGWEQHREISSALDRFSRRAKEIVEGKEADQGALIYAGGDDVLAFVPLHRVLPCVQALSQAFREELHLFKNVNGDSSTLSVGVAIVHHLSLLNEALEQARAAEKAAKGVPGKNALAIKLCKRGGETYTISGHWDNLDLYLAQLITAYRLNRIPKGLPYDVRDSLLRLTALRDDEDASALIAVIKDDTKRILKRKLQVPQRKRHSETVALLRLLESRIGIAWDEPSDQLQENAQEPEKEDRSWLIDGLEDSSKMNISAFADIIESYIHEFVIAQELASALNLAEGQPAAQPEEARV